MNPILIAVLVVGGMGLLAAVILVVASKVMYVASDENAQDIEAVLPGVNCGACGYAGCADYAAAVAKGEAATNLCVPGGPKTAQKVAAIMGQEAGEVDELVADVACNGSYDVTRDKYEYAGIMSCNASSQLHLGRSACSFGCLGFGDCVAACKFGALSVQNGVAVTDLSKCTGCGVCVDRCPKGLIRLAPRSAKTFVNCCSTDTGAVTRKNCARGCIGCKRCERVCPNDAIHVTDNLAVIDQSKCISCGLCVAECPTHSVEQRAR